MAQTYPKVTTDASSLDASSDFTDLADDREHQDKAHEQARIQAVISFFFHRQKRVRLLKKKLRQIRALQQRGPSPFLEVQRKIQSESAI
eukprot:5333051-Karenia_brevis.AAC.1